MPTRQSSMKCDVTQQDADILEEPSNKMASMQKIPPGRDKNIIKKKGFKYGLVRIDYVKGRRVGLGIKTHKDQVIVSKSEKDTLCGNRIKRLDRIIDVNGTEVADRDVCKEMLLKSLQKTYTVTLVIERPVEKEAVSAMEAFLAEAGGQSAASSPTRDLNLRLKRVEGINLLKKVRSSLTANKIEVERKTGGQSMDRDKAREIQKNSQNDNLGRAMNARQAAPEPTAPSPAKKGSKFKAILALKQKS
ncbi:hypothetical protein OESDEN_12008 [Oesophagostomum dentatum]|uniref:PDZ domain-containing protein n=1 Tax=Oesophagostomum dentatum TaxID=61180 RepID=A0A0B1SWE1_OESDE|nr:hypothetical protein OESDEN_12008 [Oesophagostomum dentatum]